ncbi:MAG: hypothetical protein Q8L12_06925, partial [Methylibium sp.]|nr:hypothetical protein [Methylibium sp.]
MTINGHHRLPLCLRGFWHSLVGRHYMTESELHDHVRLAFQAFPGPTEGEAMRALIEAGGVENFLTGLLFIRLHATGHRISREYPIGNRCAADLTLHDPQLIHIELKQLNL